MELNEYQNLAQRTANINDTPGSKIENGILGMCGEAGECADILKKYLFQGHEFDRDKLMATCSGMSARLLQDWA